MLSAIGMEAARNFAFLLLATLTAAQRGFVNDASSTKVAAWSIVASTNGTVRTAIGTVIKHPGNPLLVQDKPWEPRLDNAYPNIVHDPSNPLGAYRMWYGGFIAGDEYDKGQGINRVNAWHYATSSDGIRWEKPALGLFDLAAIPQCSPASKAAGRANNVIFGGDGTGIFYDLDDANVSRRYKVFGTLCPDGGGLVDAETNSAQNKTEPWRSPSSTGGQGCLSGVAVSSDGLHFSDYTAVTWPNPQRYDCEPPARITHHDKHAPPLRSTCPREHE